MKKKKCNFHLTKLEFSVKLLESTLMLGEKYAGGGIFKNHFIVIIYILTLTFCVSTFIVSTNTKAAVSLNLDYENGAYLVRDFSDLENLSEYVYTGGSTSGKTFKLTNSIDMKSQSFIPIGTIYNGSPFYFDGTFDGQGYTLLNINIDTNSTYATGDLGIIGYLNGTVKNLSICYGDIYLTTTDKSAGGIVGSMYGSAKMERCYNLGTKVYTYSGSRSFNIGGVIGYQDSSNCTITQCYNLGKVDNNGRSTARAGGIVGSALGKISECFNNGTITSGSTSATLTYAGGITGQGGTIENCFNKGSVTAQAKSNTIVDSNNYQRKGWLANTSSPSWATEGTIFVGMGYGHALNSDYRYGDILVHDDIDGTNGKKVEAYAGGISGESASVKYCYNIADISGGYSNIKYTIYYLIGTKDPNYDNYWADFYITTIDEMIRFSNPITNNKDFSYCYSNKINQDKSGNDLYSCDYKVYTKGIQVRSTDATSRVGNKRDFFSAAINGKYVINSPSMISDCTHNNNHNKSMSKGIVNNINASWTQSIETYLACSNGTGQHEYYEKAGMQNCRLSIDNWARDINRGISINLLYDRYDIVEVPAAPDKDDDLGFAEVIPFNNESTKLEYQKRTNDTDGNKMYITLKNNFAAKSSFPINSSLTSNPSTFNSNIWGTYSLINNNNPYLRCFYWKDSAQSF